MATSSKSTLGRPVYELRAEQLSGEDMLLEIWESPSPATPYLKAAQRVAGLTGRPLRLVETKVLKRLKDVGVALSHLRKGEPRTYKLDEEAALNLALLFRVLAPMTSIDRIRAVADGIDQMSREEAAYWLGMAVHRIYPRRVLAALRLLLTTP